MKSIFAFLLPALFVCTGCLGLSGGSADKTMAYTARDGESEIIIQRIDMPINSGFKERIYIDGKQHLVLTNGDSGKIIVRNGDHTIYAELYTLTTPKLQFTADSNTIKFIVTPYSLQDFAIEIDDSNSVIVSSPPKTSNTAKSSPASDPAPVRTSSTGNSNTNSVEGSLERAANKVIGKIPPKSRIAIVYVTSKDADVTEYIANELEFIMVDEGLILIDRSQLDRIRREQNFQLSGEVDDNHAVSVGKIAGANVIITGAVTGTGDLRRLRLRVLDTQSGQVLVAASEKF